MISVIHPSRGRPAKARHAFENWMDKSGHNSMEYRLSLDVTDPAVTEYQDLFKYEPWSVLVNDNVSVVQATNYAAKRTTGDILVYLSDDFDCPQNWAVLVEEEFYKVDRPALLKVDDCLQKFHVPVLTIPIMNRVLYERLGYFWNPLYRSMFVDEDLYWTAQKLEALRFAPHLKFPHNHVSVGKAENDDTYRRSAANWDQGKETFRRRKAEGFPL